MERDNMLLAFHQSLSPEVARPAAPPVEVLESRLNITVVFTSIAATVQALDKAGSLAETLGARITLVVPQIVPYPLPLTSPPVLLEFQEKRFEAIASASRVEIKVEIYLCRDHVETLKRTLKPHSLVVVGGPKRFWPTREKSLVRKLQRAGHEVIFTQTH